MYMFSSIYVLLFNKQVLCMFWTVQNLCMSYYVWNMFNVFLYDSVFLFIYILQKKQTCQPLLITKTLFSVAWHIRGPCIVSGLIFMPPPFQEWWRGIKCYPCPCVRSSVRSSVRPSVIKIWCLLNNFWKTASIQFKFGMLIYNIKTQVKFDLGYNPLKKIDGVMGLL